MRNGLVVSTVNSVDNMEMVRYGGRIIKVYEEIFYERLEYNPYREFVHGIVSERDKYKSEGTALLQTLAKKLANSVYGSNVRRDILDKYVCVTDQWMVREYDSSVKELTPLETVISCRFLQSNSSTPHPSCRS